MATGARILSFGKGLSIENSMPKSNEIGPWPESISQETPALLCDFSD
jgi:hypothetical protein